MKKRNLLATTAVLATLIGLSQIAQAADGNHTFTPIDQLSPQDRQQIGNQLNDYLKNLQVDWDSIVVGVDEKGQIVLRGKNADDNATISYSCYGSPASKSCKE